MRRHIRSWGVMKTSRSTCNVLRAVTKLYRRHPDKFDGPFTLRDIRRTRKTLMGVAGISKETRDRIQGMPSTMCQFKHYDRYDYFKEKREGLRVWATWLMKVAKVCSRRLWAPPKLLVPLPGRSSSVQFQMPSIPRAAGEVSRNGFGKRPALTSQRGMKVW